MTPDFRAEPSIISATVSAQNEQPLPVAHSVAAPAAPVPFRFAALDFETADYGRDSACALSIVIVENDSITDVWTSLIRPPRRDFVFTYLHGIAWSHVKSKPTFAELWPEVSAKLQGAQFVAAHNASFDRSVLQACCEVASVPTVDTSFVCTVKAARSIWGFYPTTLAHVCRHLNIPLNHHDAESDARACARILLAARDHGHDYTKVLKTCAVKSRRKP
jgi:DNA polymerase-3 subunit epsilon